MTTGGVKSAITGILSIVPDSDSNDITRSHVQLAHGSIIGHYRIIERIGAGGMAPYNCFAALVNSTRPLTELPLFLAQEQLMGALEPVGLKGASEYRLADNVQSTAFSTYFTKSAIL